MVRHSQINLHQSKQRFQQPLGLPSSLIVNRFYGHEGGNGEVAVILEALGLPRSVGLYLASRTASSIQKVRLPLCFSPALYSDRLRMVRFILVKVFRWYFKLITLHLRNLYSRTNALCLLTSHLSRLNISFSATPTEKKN